MLPGFTAMIKHDDNAMSSHQHGLILSFHNMIVMAVFTHNISRPDHHGRYYDHALVAKTIIITYSGSQLANLCGYLVRWVFCSY